MLSEDHDRNRTTLHRVKLERTCDTTNKAMWNTITTARRTDCIAVLCLNELMQRKPENSSLTHEIKQIMNYVFDSFVFCPQRILFVAEYRYFRFSAIQWPNTLQNQQQHTSLWHDSRLHTDSQARRINSRQTVLRRQYLYLTCQHRWACNIWNIHEHSDIE